MEMSDENKRGLLIGVPLMLVISGAIILFIICEGETASKR